MRHSIFACARILAVAMLLLGTPSFGDDPFTGSLEMQSGPLTPALQLDGVPMPVHQIRIVVDVKGASGKLSLDGNTPEFDEFGRLVGGLQTPHVRGDGDPGLIVEHRCTIKLLKEGDKKWSLYQLSCSGLDTSFRVAVRGTLLGAGPARVLVFDSSDEVLAVVECARYGLLVP
ncbi:MAG: hypothetical protein AAF802_03410 [Planctomycetota bacterium]